jgi:hypothetical protein
MRWRGVLRVEMLPTLQRAVGCVISTSRLWWTQHHNVCTKGSRMRLTQNPASPVIETSPSAIQASAPFPSTNSQFQHPPPAMVMGCPLWSRGCCCCCCCMATPGGTIMPTGGPWCCCCS